MAKFNCAFRTSYFYVTDEQEYEEFKKHIVVDKISVPQAHGFNRGLGTVYE